MTNTFHIPSSEFETFKTFLSQYGILLVSTRRLETTMSITIRYDEYQRYKFLCADGNIYTVHGVHKQSRLNDLKALLPSSNYGNILMINEILAEMNGAPSPYNKIIIDDNSW